MNPDSNGWVGFANYQWMIEDPNVKVIMVNTILWILVVPLFTAALGLLLAVMLDRIKHESIPKSLLFMPMAISFVGASIIFKFVYEYNEPGDVQIGLLSAVVKFFGMTPIRREQRLMQNLCLGQTERRSVNTSHWQARWY